MTGRQEFGQHIVALRTEKGFTQEQLAVEAGITRNNLSRIENGLYSPGEDILIKIGNALGMKLRYCEEK